MVIMQREGSGSKGHTDLNTYNWEQDIRNWTSRRRAATPALTEATIKYFRSAFEHTVYPDRSWFGVHDNTISLVVGNIFLAAIIYSGRDKGLWMLLDKVPPKIKGWIFYPTRSSQDLLSPLYWGHAVQWQDIFTLENTPSIWSNYALASQRIFDARRIAGDRDDTQIKRGKRRLSDFWNTSSLANALITSSKSEKENTFIESFGSFISEEEFEDKIIIPLLSKLDLTYSRQFPCKIILGTQEHYGRLDFLLTDKEGRLTIIENKLRISSDKDLYYAHGQARSYALFEGISSFVVAAPQGVWVYSLTRGQSKLERHIQPTELNQDPTVLKALLLRLR